MTSRRPGPDIVFGAGTRTPLGKFSGALKDVPMTDLAGRTAAACMRRNAVDPAAVDHMVFTTTVPSDRTACSPARVVGIKAGLPEEAGALGGGPRLRVGPAGDPVAGQQVAEGPLEPRARRPGRGPESYSRAPYAVTTARNRLQARAAGVRGHLDWAYRCPFSQRSTWRDGGEPRRGVPVHPRGHGRVGRHEPGPRARGHRVRLLSAGQIEPIEVPDGKATPGVRHRRISAGRRDARKARPAEARLQAGRAGPAGNASGVTDGAAFVLVGTRESFAAQGLAPAARIVDWAVVGVPARIMGHGPVPAIRRPARPDRPHHRRHRLRRDQRGLRGW